MIGAGKPSYVHATAIAIGEAGILISGRSGAGKSTLAEGLIAGACAMGLDAMLVGDDRVGLSCRQGRILASVHPLIAGLIERRGTGIVPVPHRPEIWLALEVALGESGGPERIERLPGCILALLHVQPRPNPRDILPRIVAALPHSMAETVQL